MSSFIVGTIWEHNISSIASKSKKVLQTHSGRKESVCDAKYHHLASLTTFSETISRWRPYTLNIYWIILANNPFHGLRIIAFCESVRDNNVPKCTLHIPRFF